MIVFILILCFEIIMNSTISSKGNYHKNYISPNGIKGVKGIFVVLILFSHFAQYVNLDSLWDMPYNILRIHLDQMVVVPFLFYSGFGIMKSIMNKGDSYVKQLILRRFPRVLFDFIKAVFLFLIMNTVLGIQYSIRHIILSFVGWESIGNSNWYILVILLLYIATFISFSLVKKSVSNRKEILGCIMLTVFAIMIAYFLQYAGKPSYYYNTLITYVWGCWYAVFHGRIEVYVMDGKSRYWVGIISVGLGYLFSCLLRADYGIISYTVYTFMFNMLLILITMKISINSKLLNWFGDHVFSVYILQRIPMILLEHLGFAEKNKYLFLFISILLTMILANIFEKIKLEMLIACKKR